MKTALKGLTQADLSLFKAHQSLSKQRAFRLDSEIFVERFYPGLQGSYDLVLFSLVVIGPGGRPAHRLTRMAMRAFGGRHWYIKGEPIYDPAEDPGRYDKLSENDFALVAFDGNERPRTVTLLLVSVVEDAELHALLSDRFEFPHATAARELSEAALAHLHANTLGAYTHTQHPIDALRRVAGSHGLPMSSFRKGPRQPVWRNVLNRSYRASRNRCPGRSSRR